nr:stage 0 sporulation protein [Lachnospiraceae bacterium]
ELRQIGVRDETKIIGGMGICGRELCCHAYLSDFAPVSIRMAKEQNLSLNPAKISGVCGRLMCCLRNEEDTYEYLNRKLPFQGDMVTTQDGKKGIVESINVLRQKVKVMIEEGDEKEIKEYPVEELTFKSRRSQGHGKGSKRSSESESVDEKELKELESLEEKEGAGSKLDE